MWDEKWQKINCRCSSRFYNRLSKMLYCANLELALPKKQKKTTDI